jgi:hypothetical protein
VWTPTRPPAPPTGGERTGAALVDLAIAGFLLVFGIVAGSILIAVDGWGIATGDAYHPTGDACQPATNGSVPIRNLRPAA